ncbi:MAG: TonB family protein [Bryobacteraceae bacterium]
MVFVRSRPAPFAFSLLAHGMILAWVASGPVRHKPKSLYDQAIAPHASKLVWYNFKEKLPDVRPSRSQVSSKPPRAEMQIASQEIVAGSPKSPRANQFVWLPAPKIELTKELKSPNLLALHAPHVEPPKPKLFAPPPDSPKPTAETPALAAPPKVASTADIAKAPLETKVAAPARPELKKFVAPKDKEKPAPRTPGLEAPPEVQMARNVAKAPVIGNELGLQPVKLQPKAFVAPRAGRNVGAQAAALPAPPTVEAAARLGSGVSAPVSTQVAAPARRVYVPPSGPSKAGLGTNPSAVPMGEAPAVSTGAATAGVSMAIVGLNPSASANVPLPEGSRDAQFSAGPRLRLNGGEGSGDGATLVVPGLLIRNATPQDGKPVVVARAAPTSNQTLRAAVRDMSVRPPDPPANSDHPVAQRVVSAPDPMLAGRDIYAMSVQMPNVTSYSGSWMIWFAEREARFGSSPALSPPVPVRKVDPKYVASAMDERVEGRVRLAAIIRKDGKVDSVQLLVHLDDRLDQSAAQAIDKWQFEPALRNGKPVDVDAVIEIPFRLAPKVAK